MGPWMADTIRQCDGLVDEMSYWTFSDVFEEQGVVKKPFYGGYGLIAAGKHSEASVYRIPDPASVRPGTHCADSETHWRPEPRMAHW